MKELLIIVFNNILILDDLTLTGYWNDVLKDIVQEINFFVVHWYKSKDTK